MADGQDSPAERNQPERPAERCAEAAYELIYNTPPEVVQEMDERIRELREQTSRPAQVCIAGWRAG